MSMRIGKIGEIIGGEIMEITLPGNDIQHEVIITKDVYDKILAISEVMGDNEAGGLLICDETINGTIIVEDIIIPKQIASGGDVTITAEDVAKTLEGFITTNPEMWEKCRGWWHSHGGMEAFWSITDTDNIKNLMKMFTPVLSIVTNSVGQMIVRIDGNTKDGKQFTIDGLIPTIDNALSEAKKWAAEQSKNVEISQIWKKSKWWNTKKTISNIQADEDRIADEGEGFYKDSFGIYYGY